MYPEHTCDVALKMEVKAEEDQPLTEAHIFVIALDTVPEDMIRSNGRFLCVANMRYKDLGWTNLFGSS